ncbi:MAG: PLP-dependent cysteine synthase family protein [Clostridia bacterium]|nr:PLP-dependent cysteine synthase family protein [Clostridia bacterium]
MNLENLIGNTPMIEIKYIYNGEEQCIHAKLECYNYSGSIKDRVIYHILSKAKISGDLKDGQPIVEATSGNTGIALASIGALLGHPVHIFMPDWVSTERQSLIKMYGATIHLVSRKEGGFKAAIEKANELAVEINGFKTDQFNNPQNVEAHYLGTAEEILKQYPEVDSFVSGIGTGGTLIGIGKKLKEVKNADIYGLEPSTLPLLTQGIAIGTHKIEGIGDDFIPSIVDLNLLSKVITIDDKDAINMAKKLSRELGLGVGISSGANFLAAVLLNKSGNIVTVFPDDNKKYISTELSGEIDLSDELISNKITLLS